MTISQLLSKVGKYIYDDNFRRSAFVSEIALQDIQSMNILASLLPNNKYIPVTGFTMSPTAIVHIVNEILLLRRRTIVEFGSGLSTMIVSRLLSQYEISAEIYSVDHDNEWQQQIRKMLSEEGLNKYVQLVHAELEPVECLNGCMGKWYSKSILERYIPSNIDLVIVDGPPSTEEHNRFNAVPFVKSRLSSDYSLFIDDVLRKGESEIVSAWSDLLQLQPTDYLRYALFTTNKRVNTAPIGLSYNYRFWEAVKAKKISI